jgi:hypothetical protein
MRRLLLFALATVPLVATASAAPPLTDADAAKLRKVIRPLDGEDPFATIPWETNLWEARTKAAAAGKPILLWEMDGHPLGCG